jgi:hypothetical protein
LWFRWRFCWFWVTSLCCLLTMNDILCFTFYSCVVTWNTCKSRTSENEMELWNRGFKLP